MSTSRTSELEASLDRLIATAKRVKKQRDQLLLAAKRTLRIGYDADDCGDHCRPGCHWCELRAAVENAEATDPAWCYFCDRPKSDCACHLDPNGVPAEAA